MEKCIVIFVEYDYCESTQDKELARELVKLGYRGTGETLSREEFDALKKAEREKKTQKVVTHMYQYLRVFGTYCSHACT